VFRAYCIYKRIGSSTGTVFGQILTLELEGLHAGGIFVLTKGEFHEKLAVHAEIWIKT
jgi:hypothetical protein